jgi:hypothetical protein
VIGAGASSPALGVIALSEFHQHLPNLMNREIVELGLKAKG